MEFSVVVTIVDGGATLRRCLEALKAQEECARMEVVVPYDETVSDMGDLRRHFPHVTFDVLNSQLGVAPSFAHTRHELFDRRRALGLARARGDVVAILEDRGIPDPDWASGLIRLHAQRPSEVAIGGPVENGCDRLLDGAVYFRDFGRYQLPFTAGAREFLSDVNVSYKRAALEATRDLWRDRYHEPVIHDALRRAGHCLFLAADPVVRQFRGRLRLRALMSERVE